MRKLNVAQIGVGHDHAPCIFESITRLTDVFNVVGYHVTKEEEERYNTNEHMRKTYEGKTPRLTLDEIFSYPNLDAVIIESDDVNLTEYAQMALDKGFDIHMDKPGSVDSDTFEKMVSTAKRNGCVFHTGYMYRYNPAYIKTRKNAKNGAYGDIYSVELHMDCEHGKSKKEWLSSFPGGMLYFLGCHLIDIIFDLKGIPEEIIPLSCSTGMDGITTDDFGMAVFKYKNGVSFAKTCASEPGGFMRRQCVICGTKETIELKPFEAYDESAKDEKNMYTVVRNAVPDKGWWHEFGTSKTELYNRYDPMMRSFAAICRKEKTNPYTYEYEARLHRIILAACGAECDYKGEIKL